MRPCPQCGKTRLRVMATTRHMANYPGRVVQCMDCLFEAEFPTPEIGRDTAETTLARAASAGVQWDRMIDVWRRDEPATPACQPVRPKAEVFQCRCCGALNASG